MPVRHWTFAGLVLTYRCPARCESCWLCCGPHREGDSGGEMSAEMAVRLWRGLSHASPHGCRIHLTGGEPFIDYERLVRTCVLAGREGLLQRSPLEKIETNAFWAVDADLVRRRIAELDSLGMGVLAISADPYHQQFVPIERCRLVADVAREILGPARVRVRWMDWLESGMDTGGMDGRSREELFCRYAAGGRERLSGRAADRLTPLLQLKPLSEIADTPCGERLLRGRHVHIDGGGRVMPSTCAGIVMGRVDGRGPGEIWSDLNHAAGRGEVLSTLAEQGPKSLAAMAGEAGFVPRKGYAGRCHLCWDVRRYLSGKGMYAGELDPPWLYRDV